jgi:uncharacterized protein (TIRG00374 family)
LITLESSAQYPGLQFFLTFIRYNLPMRSLLIAIVLLLGLIFVFVNLADMQATVETLQRGNWLFLLLAFGVQAAWVLNVAASFRAVYRAIGLDEEIGRLFMAVSAANFINVVAPSGGMGGIAVFISQARRRGYSAARVTVAGGLVVLFDYIGFLCVLFVGLLVLMRRNNLNMVELTSTAILVFVAGVLAGLIYLGMHSAEEMGRALAWMARLVNRIFRPFIHREYLSEQRAFAFAHDAHEGLAQLRQQPGNLLLPAALGLSSKALLVVILFLAFMAFGVPFSPGTLIAGFSIGYLFLIVSPTPAGIGFVEGALTLGLRSLHVPLGDATVVALAYRGLTLWIPLFFGMLAFRWLSRGENVKPLPGFEGKPPADSQYPPSNEQ